jgi:integrase
VHTVATPDVTSSVRARRVGPGVSLVLGEVLPPSANTIGDLRKVLRSALSHAMTEELVAKNVASLAKLPTVRRRKGQAWSTEEARQFLESARRDNDPLYAAYVQVLVLGLRKGEVLGLTWDGVNLEKAKLTTDLQTGR